MTYRVLKFIFIFPYLYIFPLWCIAQYDTDQKRNEYVLHLTKTYCSDASEILQSQKEMQSYLQYLHKMTKREEILDRFATMVHEACHGYNSDIQFIGGYFITKGIQIKANWGFDTQIFNSNELNNFVAKDVRDKIFRYDTYVGDKSNTSSQVNGIYGMIDEFSAYYHGTKAFFELRKYFETFAPYKTQPKTWLNAYLGSPYSYIYAYEEFRLFISWYLRYAQKKHPTDYQRVMADQNLRVAFTLLDDLYKQLVSEYFETRKDIISKLTTAGYELKLDSDYLYIYDSNGSGSGTGVPDSKIAYLKSLFTDDDYKMLADFSIKGVNLTNYSQFLKK
jgi:hypothetical protein